VLNKLLWLIVVAVQMLVVSYSSSAGGISFSSAERSVVTSSPEQFTVSGVGGTGVLLRLAKVTQTQVPGSDPEFKTEVIEIHTGIDGSYATPLLWEGTYALTPSKDGYDFHPPMVIFEVKGTALASRVFNFSQKKH